ncbi:MAG: succinylglutamate desuccinylase/aspartoacylase family protein [Ruminococcus sp.]|nr:succinylglutamate desuccinylase/aspartoacylase family protein [Ruminococcus sp.]
MIKTISQAGLAVNEKLKIQKNSIKNGTSKKRICIVTGTHGDELEGQYICYALGEYLKENIDKLNGTVDIYPALNPLGIDSIMRGIPGYDLDMNRTFPGTESGTMPEMIAHEILEDLKGADVCIDIHASNIFLREIPQIRMSIPTSEILLPYAKMLNVDFVWVHASATVLESTLAHSLNSAGTKTLVVEMGVGMRITKEYCKQLMDGIINLLVNLEMLKDVETAEIREPVVSLDGAVGFVNSPAAGIFVPDTEFGSIVSEGDIIGRIVDPLTGEIAENAVAPCSGLLFTLREYPVVYGGSLIARILRQEDKEND